MILAIDPGRDKSGYVLFDEETSMIRRAGIDPNPLILRHIAVSIAARHPRVVIIGTDVIETARWSGRFEQAAISRWGREVAWLSRKTVATELCGDSRAGDGDIRQALIDRWGGKDKAIGGRRCQLCHGKGWRGQDHNECQDCAGTGYEHLPGPLHGTRTDEWQALGLAVAYSDIAARVKKESKQ